MMSEKCDICLTCSVVRFCCRGVELMEERENPTLSTNKLPNPEDRTPVVSFLMFWGIAFGRDEES